MGQTPDNIAEEIADLRQETSVIVDELRHRANLGYVARGVGGRVGERAETMASDLSRRAEMLAGEVGDSLPEPVRRNSSIFGGALLGVLAALGLFTFTSIREAREPSLSDKIGDRLFDSADLAREQAARLSKNVRGAMRQAQTTRGVRVSVAKENDGMLKRLLWIGLVSVMGALGAMLFQRMTAAAWRRTMHEEPPKK